MKIFYYSGKTWFHGMDPITKTSWCLLIDIWLFCLRDLYSVLFVTSIIFVFCVVGANINLKEYGKALFVVGISGFGIVLFQGIFQPGIGFNLWFIHLSYKGLSLGTAILSRLIGIVASALAFSTTTSPKDISTSMIKLGISYRISHLVYLSLRFMPIVTNDLECINDIQQLRQVKGKLKKTTKALITLLATELRRVEDAVIALDTRAFGLYSVRTITKPVYITTSGIILVTITLVIMVIHLVYLCL